MKNYVLGFLFTHSGVVLIQKNTPEWQRGKLNGIGGSIEEGETPYAAMVREFAEETGLQQLEWNKLGIMHGKGRAGPFIMHVFFATNKNLDNINYTTSEGLVTVWLDSEWQKADRVDNLDFLIPAARHGKWFITGEYLGLPDVVLPGVTAGIADLTTSGE